MLINWFFQPRCLCCQRLITQSTSVCTHCLSDFPYIPLKSGNLLEQPNILKLFDLPDCDGLVACGWYHGVLKSWLAGLKFNQQIYYKFALQQIISIQMNQFWTLNEFIPDLCLTIPLSNTRFALRGFNQVYQTWQPSLVTHSHLCDKLKRIKQTKPQSELTRRQRQKNIQGAFSIDISLTNKRVAIVDDVITSGSTVNEAARTCINAGAAQVWVFATALTPLDSECFTKKQSVTQ